MTFPTTTSLVGHCNMLMTLQGIQLMPQKIMGDELIYANPNDPLQLQEPLAPLIQIEEETPREIFASRLPFIPEEPLTPQEADKLPLSGPLAREWHTLQGEMDAAAREARQLNSIIRGNAALRRNAVETFAASIVPPQEFELVTENDEDAFLRNTFLGNIRSGLLLANLFGTPLDERVAGHLFEASVNLRHLYRPFGAAMMAELAAWIVHRIGITRGAPLTWWRSFAAKSWLEGLPAERYNDAAERFIINRGKHSAWSADVDTQVSFLASSAKISFSPQPITAAEELIRAARLLAGKRLLKIVDLNAIAGMMLSTITILNTHHANPTAIAKARQIREEAERQAMALATG